MGANRKARKTKKIPIGIVILVDAILIFAAYNSMITLALGIWGSGAMGVVDSYHSRLDDVHAGANRSRTVSKGYSFRADGKEYRGYVIYWSDEAWPALRNGETRSERIRYFSFLPYINKPASLCELEEMSGWGLLYHLFAPMGCLFLLFLVTRTYKKQT